MSERHVSAFRLSIESMIVCLTVAASASLAAQPPQVSPPPSVPASVPLRDRDWDTMSVDITVRHWQQMTAGEAQPSTLPTTRYHVEWSMASGQWKTVITIVDLPEVRIATPTGETTRVNTSQIVRIENDEDGTPMRYFNQRGERVVLRAGTPPATATSPAGSVPPSGTLDVADTLGRLAIHQTTPQARPLPPATRDWVESLVPSRADRERRRKVLEGNFGPVVGQVRGLDRVVRVDGKNVDEVLIDPDMGVPVEANTMRDGQLVARRAFAYERNADGDFVRRAMRTESVLPNDSSRHAVMEIEFNNLTFERSH